MDNLTLIWELTSLPSSERVHFYDTCTCRLFGIDLFRNSSRMDIFYICMWALLTLMSSSSGGRQHTADPDGRIWLCRSSFHSSHPEDEY